MLKQLNLYLEFILQYQNPSPQKHYLSNNIESQGQVPTRVEDFKCFIIQIYGNKSLRYCEQLFKASFALEPIFNRFQVSKDCEKPQLLLKVVGSCIKNFQWII